MSQTSLPKSAGRAGRVLLDELWSAGAGSASRFRKIVVYIGRVAYITVEGFLRDLCALRASALTFASLMGLVPILALAFAVLRGLGWRGDRLETMILERVTILSPDAIKIIVTYIDNTNFAGLGAVGGSLVFMTFVSVLTNIESSLNAIWGNVPHRPLLRRVIDYFGVMVVAPVLLAVATSLTAAVQSSVAVHWLSQLWGLGPTVEYALGYAAYGVVWLLFAFIYMFIPNTTVRFVPAVAGGMIAGTVWHFTQWGYIRFQVGMANYNAIYGALAQLPLLMAWVYVSWVIVLLGAEIAFAVQNVSAYSRDRRVSTATGHALREYAGLSAAVELANAAEGRTEAPTIEALAVELDVPVRLMRELVGELVRAGLVHLSGDSPERCFLSLAPDRIPVGRVLDVLRGSLPTAYGGAQDALDERVQNVFLKLAKTRDSALADVTLKELAVG